MKNRIAFSDWEFLDFLSKKMIEQDKRGTSYVYFVVYDKVKHYTDKYGMRDWDGKERREDADDESLCEDCEKLVYNNSELPDDCENCDDDAFNYFYYNDEPLMDHGIFFTAEACDEYIKRRNYEFNKPYSYGLSAYWSNEIRRLMDIIVKLNSDRNVLK